MILFRVDISPQSGLSRLRRCVYLASLLKKDNQVLLCVREDKKTAKFLAEKNVPFTLAKDPGALEIAGAKAIIFDLDVFSAQDAVLLEKARKAGVKAIQLTPGGNGTAAVDIVISGAEYALLHHKFRHFNKAKRKYRKQIRNIFINLGDLLPYRDLRAIVDTLHRLRYKMKIEPSLSLKKADKRNLMKIYPGIHFCGKSESLARAYFEADVALVLPGEEALEAACVGTPALYMLHAKGQEALTETCTGLGIGMKSPSLADFSVQSVRDAMAPLNPETREKMGAAGKKLVDGLGVQKFFKVLKENGVIV
jgi:spore coat polysaccharide biosynthesis predicted glycosyltransferase SpsG